MKTCYNCGKILFTSKVLGQIGDNMYTFCSDKCRTATWHKIGVKERNSLDSTESEIDIDNASTASFEKKENGVKSGSPSKLIIQNAEYSYSAKSDRVTIKIGSLQNKSGGKSGSLRFELFMSKTGPYAPGSKISGFTLGISNTYEPLRVNSAYTNITSTVRSLEKKSGSYRPILFVKEQNEDNSWKIAAYANFPKTEKIL